jgi:monoamine oxidase
MAPHITLLDPPTLFSCNPYYSPLSITHSGDQGQPLKTIHTAGQVGRRLDGSIPSTYEEQVNLAFANLGECLNAAGASPRDIVKLTYYIAGYKPENRYHADVLLRFLNGHRPPATLVPVPALARREFLFEIEAVAVVRDLKGAAAIGGFFKTLGL